jgi:phenylalanyl-tRNA synthetase alpha chain
MLFSSSMCYCFIKDFSLNVSNYSVQVTLVDRFVHPKKKLTSHCYRLVYRHMEKTLTQDEVNSVHKEIENAAKEQLKVDIR